MEMWNKQLYLISFYTCFSNIPTMMKMLCISTLLLAYIMHVIIVESCPVNCTCSYQSGDLNVFCKGRGLTQVPLDIPSDVHTM